MVVTPKISIAGETTEINHLCVLGVSNECPCHALSVIQCVITTQGPSILLKHRHMLELRTAQVWVEIDLHLLEG